MNYLTLNKIKLKLLIIYGNTRILINQLFFILKSILLMFLTE